MVGWDPSVYKVTKLRETSQLIHSLVYNSHLDVTFCITFIYASNIPYERLILWDDLKQVSIGRKEAWIALGDFNNVLYSFERLGGEQVHWRETKLFVECITENGLIDLKAKGCYFMWVRRGENGDRKCSKIDRALVNMEWLSPMSDSTANFLSPGVSDH